MVKEEDNDQERYERSKLLRMLLGMDLNGKYCEYLMIRFK